MAFPNALKHTPIFSVFQFSQNSLTTKTSLEAYFREKWILQKFFASYIKKRLNKNQQNFPGPSSWQVYLKERTWRVKFFSSMSNYGRKNIILKQTLYNPKKPAGMFWDLRVGLIWPYSACCFEKTSGNLVFKIFIWISTASQKQIYCHLFEF